MEAIVSEYRHKNTRYALRRLAQTLLNDRKGEASCLGTSKLLLAIGGLDDVASTGDLLLLDSKALMSDHSNRVYKRRQR